MDHVLIDAQILRREIRFARSHAFLFREICIILETHKSLKKVSFCDRESAQRLLQMKMC